MPEVKTPNVALQFSCQHEQLDFKEGAYTIVCRRCEKVWRAIDFFGIPDVSMKAQQLFVPTRCQQFLPPDTSPSTPTKSRPTK